jgi:DNA-binding GntR family transcriptional regulator
VLKLLEAEGFVALTPHVGAVVTRMDHPDLAEKFEVMSALEQLAAMKVAKLQPAETLNEIRRLYRGMARSAKEGKPGQYYRQNDEFHRAIVLGCGNATLNRMHETLMFHVSRARNRVNYFEPLQESAFEHHSAIVSSILAGESAAAGRAMADHLDEVTGLVLSRIDKPRE